MPPPNRWNPDIPEQLEAVILKALVKNPDARFQTADQFAAALGKAAGQAGLEAVAGGRQALLDVRMEHGVR